MKKKLLLTSVSYCLLQLMAINSATAADTVYTVLNTNDSGSDSLRAHETSAAGASGNHTIHFNSLVGTNQTITLASDLPAVTGSATSITVGGTGGQAYGGTGHLTIDGAGTYKLANVTAGTVNFVDVNLSNGPITNSGTGVSISHSYDSTYNGIMSGAGTFTKLGTGTLTLTGVNTFTGNTTVSAGTLKMSGAGKLASTMGITVSSGATLDVNDTTQAIDEIAGAGTIALKAGSLTSNTSNTSTFSGTLTGDSNSTFTKAGTGALTLSGTTSGFSGTFALSGSGGVAGSAASLPKKTVNTGTTVTFTDTGAATYDGVMSGTGSLVMNGSGGNVTLNKAQTYTGGTTLTAGTITSAVDEALPTGKDAAINSTFNLNGKKQHLGALTGAGNITLGSGALKVDSGTFSGIVSGTGSLEKLTSSTLTLSGANTYTGGTKVTEGNLTGDFTSLQGNIDVATGATLTFSHSTTGTYNGVLTGAGALVKAGSGNLTLGGTSTAFTGSTTISAGTLTVQTSTLNAPIVNNATLAFSQTNNGTFSKVISGSGAITKAGTGEVTLTGMNTYTGNNTISAGKLIGTTDSIKNNIANSGIFAFDQATSGTYAGVLSGAGTFEKKGLGTVTMSGTNTGTGALSIKEGKIYVTGTIANPATVDLGARLGGTGTTAAIINNGSVSVGGSTGATGSLTMTGNYTQSAGGRLHIKLGATTDSDYLSVDPGGSGIATLAAGTQIVVYPKSDQTYAVGNTFDVIRTSAAVLNPTNATFVSGNLVPLVMTASTASNNLRATISAVGTPLNKLASNTSAANSFGNALASSTAIIPHGVTKYLTAINLQAANPAAQSAALNALSGNQMNGSSAATSGALGAAMSMGVSALTGTSTGSAAAALVANSSQNLNIKEVQELLAFNAMDIREDVSNSSKANNIKNYVSSTNRAKMHRGHFGGNESVWVKGLFDRYVTDTTSNNAGFRANTGALLIGKNNVISMEDKLGFFGGYGNTNLKYKSSQGSSHVDHYLFGVNMASDNQDVPVTYGATVGLSRYKNKRNLVIGTTINETATSHHNSYNLALNGEVAKNFYQGDLLVRPKLGLQLFSQWHQAYTEKGTAGDNLHFKKKNSTALNIKPGVEFSQIIKGDGLTVMPSAGIAYVYTADIGSKTNKLSLVDSNIAFNTTTKNDSKHGLALNVGLVGKHRNGTELGLKYEGTIKQKAREHQVTLNAEWKI